MRTGVLAFVISLILGVMLYGGFGSHGSVRVSAALFIVSLILLCMIELGLGGGTHQGKR